MDCGTQLPDEANFCWNCGKTQKDVAREEDQQWETCEIVWNIAKHGGFFSSDKSVFWAKAIGPSGVYNAGQTEEFPRGYPEDNDQVSIDAWEGLVAKLTEDGWEPTGSKGGLWFEYGFHRRVKKEAK